jgi:hypothetical protein
VRLWDDMPTDPKWRVVRYRALQSVTNVSIATVIGMFSYMLAKADKNGDLINWDDEDVAAALEIETEQVFAIREAMQGKVLDGNHLKGWNNRQPNRHDNSIDRVRAFRERRNALKRDVTQCNAPEEKREDTERVSSLRSESSVSEKPISTRKRKTPNSRIEYPPDFERFWHGYPTDSNMSKAEALREWEKLDTVDREAAERSLSGFRAYCSKNADYRPVHAVRYLKLRRFDGHISTNGHDGTAPALSEKDAAFRWWMDQGMSREKAEERWEMILQRRQQHD